MSQSVLTGKKVVITGGAGFVGSQLGYQLHKAGCDVILMDNMSFGHLDNIVIDGKTFGTLVVQDIRAPLQRLVALFAGVDVVYHLAGIAALPVCQADPQLAYDVNVSGTGNILEAARLAGVRRVVFASTSAIYENTKSDIFAESDPVKPDLVYSMTKVCAENLCTAFAKNYGLDTIIVRFFNVYGPHQDFKRASPPFTSYLSRELVHGRVPVLFNSSTTALRDYIFSADMIRLLILMGENQDHFNAEIFNACSGKGYSAPAIFDLMRAHAQQPTLEAEFKNPTLFWEKYPSLIQGNSPLQPERIIKEVYKMSIGDPSKAMKRFKWGVETDLEEGLRQVYQYAVSLTQRS